jgi:hypothetical protein
VAYQFEFFRRTRDVPAGKSVKRHTADFADLEAARQFGISELKHDNVLEMDGCRIYLDGVYQTTISVHSEPSVV